MPQPPRVARVDDLPALRVLDGALTWRPVRRELGVRAFGVNAYTAAKAGDLLIEEHTEEDYRHEELYVVLRGHARFVIDGEAHDAPAGTLVFLPDPTSLRTATAVADDTAALAVGGPPDGAYEPSAWEEAFAAEATD